MFIVSVFPMKGSKIGSFMVLGYRGGVSGVGVSFGKARASGMMIQKEL